MGLAASTSTPRHAPAAVPARIQLREETSERAKQSQETEQRREAMERPVPVRSSHTSTSDLLTWSPTADGASPAASSRPSLKPAGGITPAMFGAPVSDNDAEDLSNSERRLMSGSKMKEMTGSGIFTEEGVNGDSESSNPANRTSVRMYQQTVAGISQISFRADGSVSPKKPSSLPEVAKQRELSGTFESDAEAKINKQLSEAKNKELSGSNIFGPPPESPVRPLAARNMELQGNVDFALPQPRSVHTSVRVSNPAGGHSNITFSEDPATKTAKKIHNQKFQELTGNNIFKEDASPGSADKSLSSAKLKEMNGNDIFSDGKASSRDYLGGVRKPPGGTSSIALI